MKRLPCASNGGAINSVVAYCLVAPYFMVAHGYRESCCCFISWQSCLTLSRHTPALIGGLVFVCSPNWGWYLCIDFRSNCTLICSACWVPVVNVSRAPCLRISPQNHPLPMWTELVGCRASIVPVLFCFAGIHVCWVVFRAACWLSNLLAGFRTCLCWLQCTYALSQLLFLVGYIRWWSPLGCRWCWFVCILVTAMASSSRNWIYPLSWISPPVLILCFWTGFLQLTDLLLELLLCLGSLFDCHQSPIVNRVRFSLSFLDVQCRQIACTWHLWTVLAVLGACVWTWLC